MKSKIPHTQGFSCIDNIDTFRRGETDPSVDTTTTNRDLTMGLWARNKLEPLQFRGTW